MGIKRFDSFDGGSASRIGAFQTATESSKAAIWDENPTLRGLFFWSLYLDFIFAFFQFGKSVRLLHRWVRLPPSKRLLYYRSRRLEWAPLLASFTSSSPVEPSDVSTMRIRSANPFCLTCTTCFAWETPFSSSGVTPTSSPSSQTVEPGGSIHDKSTQTTLELQPNVDVLSFFPSKLAAEWFISRCCDAILIGRFLQAFEPQGKVSNSLVLMVRTTASSISVSKTTSPLPFFNSTLIGRTRWATTLTVTLCG